MPDTPGVALDRPGDWIDGAGGFLPGPGQCDRWGSEQQKFLRRMLLRSASFAQVRAPF